MDGISTRMLKETAYTIAPMLSALYNKSISSGTVPDSWKLSLITPVPKHGEPSDPNNYRPILLLPIVTKQGAGTYYFFTNFVIISLSLNTNGDFCLEGPQQVLSYQLSKSGI